MITQYSGVVVFLLWWSLYYIVWLLSLFSHIFMWFSAVLTYRHELGMNYNFIRPDLIVGSCLQVILISK